MAAVDYHGILVALKAAIEGDSNTSGIPVKVEEDPTFDLAGSGSAIVLSLTSRREAAGQPLAAGKRTRWNVRVSCWAVGFAASFDEASKLRDDTTGKLELALMNNRTAGGKVAAGWLEGGDFITVRDQAAGPYAMAETIFVGEALAIA